MHIDSTSPLCFTSFITLLNKQLTRSYDTVLIFNKSSISLSLPHNLWGDDFVLGTLDSNPWSVRCQQGGHIWTSEVIGDLIRIGSRIRFTKSVVVKLGEGSLLFVVVEVG